MTQAIQPQERHELRRGGQVGYYRPEATKPAIPVYRESPDHPWLPCEDSGVSVPTASIGIGEHAKTPGFMQYCTLMSNYGYTPKPGGMVALSIAAHPKEHRALANYYYLRDDDSNDN